MQLAKQLIEVTISQNKVQAEKLQQEVNHMIYEMSGKIKRIHELQSDNRSLEYELRDLNSVPAPTPVMNPYGDGVSKSVSNCSVLQPEKCHQ